MEYTKGEWRAEEGYTYIYITAFEKDKEKRSDVANIPTSNDNCVANAHLIAAAPDMYEVLKRMRVFYETGEMDFQKVKQAILLALAKANGKMRDFWINLADHAE